MEEDKILTIEEVSSYIKIPRQTLYLWARNGEIPAIKVGKHWRFRKSSINEWMEKIENKGHIKLTMPTKKLPDLIIGDIKINPPIIQGGMGVRVSAHNLASAVSIEGALGVIAAVGLGEEWPNKKVSYKDRSSLAFRDEIRKAKALTKNPIGVNIMCALTNYDDLVQDAQEENVDVIISGAGLPLKLPSMVKKPNIKLVPIVSSAKAADIICRAWSRKFNRFPDAIVVEGPLAGGHLGFSFEELNSIDSHKVEDIVREVIKEVSQHEKSANRKIPVIAAGGVFDGKDIAKMLKLGASGVQMASRFVCTYECDAASEYKQAFLNAKKEDILIIKSPVGMPGRVIINEFVKRIQKGEKFNFICPYHCLRTCDPEKVNYCIADALINASKGNFDKGFAMCGSNTYRINKIVSVKELIGELAEDCLKELEI